MTFSFLITRPKHDDTTHYLFAWSEEIINLAKKRDINIFDLSAEKANKSEFENKLKKFNPELIMMNGHGDENLVTGHKNQVLVQAGVNELLLKDKIIYALSCRSAKVLGQKSVQAGAKNYTGYEDDFIFMYEPELFTRPLKDSTATLFLAPSNLFIESVIKGNTIETAYGRTTDLMKKNFSKSISTLNKDPTTARFLWWNLKNFKSHGNMQASVS